MSQYITSRAQEAAAAGGIARCARIVAATTASVFAVVFVAGGLYDHWQEVMAFLGWSYWLNTAVACFAAASAVVLICATCTEAHRAIKDERSAVHAAHRGRLAVAIALASVAILLGLARPGDAHTAIEWLAACVMYVTGWLSLVAAVLSPAGALDDVE